MVVTPACDLLRLFLPLLTTSSVQCIFVCIHWETADAPCSFQHLPSSMSIRRVRLHLFTKLRPVRTLSSLPRTHSNDYRKRLNQLEQYAPKEDWYPRVSASPTISEFVSRHGDVAEGQTRDERLTLLGRVKSVRKAGSKLVFVTIEQNEQELQVVLRLSDGLIADDLASFSHIARKGDTFSFTGQPHRTQRGQLSVLATERPVLFSPSLHQIPEYIKDAETISHNRHVDMLAHPGAIQTIKLRHTIEKTVSEFLTSREFVSVKTPILQAGAGGAIARPFETRANEFAEKSLQLRIAPELWLKRLILGGMDRVFEMGPVFRNEGVDATHNPEFTMCEFYAAHATLEQLMGWTEGLLNQVAQVLDKQEFPPFAKLDFIPTIEKEVGPLPDLEADDAEERLLDLFAAHGLRPPQQPSLPRLLDALSAHFIEPQCERPTFIVHHPAALSPLAKHFNAGQRVSARAELFIKHKEIANMYEEQNSPFEQEKAFNKQLSYRKVDGEGHDNDLAYLQALEWGLPPTGGWGCGIDRLVMLFAGKDRIADVLTFGSLTNVVGSAIHE